MAHVDLLAVEIRLPLAEQLDAHVGAQAGLGHLDVVGFDGVHDVEDVVRDGVSAEASGLVIRGVQIGIGLEPVVPCEAAEAACARRFEQGLALGQQQQGALDQLGCSLLCWHVLHNRSGADIWVEM